MLGHWGLMPTLLDRTSTISAEEAFAAVPMGSGRCPLRPTDIGSPRVRHLRRKVQQKHKEPDRALITFQKYGWFRNIFE